MNITNTTERNHSNNNPLQPQQSEDLHNPQISRFAEQHIQNASSNHLRSKRARATEKETSSNAKQPKFTSVSTPSSQHQLQASPVSNAVEDISTLQQKTPNRLERKIFKGLSRGEAKTVREIADEFPEHEAPVIHKALTRLHTQKILNREELTLVKGKPYAYSMVKIYNEDLSPNFSPLEKIIFQMLKEQGPKTSIELYPLILHPNGKRYTPSGILRTLKLLSIKGILNEVFDDKSKAFWYSISNQNEKDNFPTENPLENNSTQTTTENKKNRSIPILEQSIIQKLKEKGPRTCEELQESLVRPEGGSYSKPGIYTALRTLLAYKMIESRGTPLLYSIAEPSKETTSTQTTTTTAVELPGEPQPTLSNALSKSILEKSNDFFRKTIWLQDSKKWITDPLIQDYLLDLSFNGGKPLFAEDHSSDGQ